MTLTFDHDLDQKEHSFFRCDHDVEVWQRYTWKLETVQLFVDKIYGIKWQDDLDLWHFHLKINRNLPLLDVIEMCKSDKYALITKIYGI